MKKILVQLLDESIKACFETGTLKKTDLPLIEVELPREGAHGDYASNVAMVFASSQRENPRKIAEKIVDNIHDHRNVLDKVEIAGPGFINFFIKKQMWLSFLRELDELGECYGQSTIGNGVRVQIEFVSANPTGPLHIGHARGAAVGDTIANILRAVGYSVSREYYINDAGNQMKVLGNSTYLRYREIMGEKIDFPSNFYQGDYITDIAREIVEQYGDTFKGKKEEEVIPFFVEYTSDTILKDIKKDLENFGVKYDCYFSEKELYKDNGVGKLLEDLKEKGYIYKEGKTLWFKTTEFGDEKDRVVIRENGDPTYFAADIAYHKNKYSRNFDMVIDIWGADHHGYVPRMYAGVQALGKRKEALKVLLVQLVNLLRDAVPVAMSTRAGQYVTLKEVVTEVGKDAARYNFLMRRSNSHLDFDLELAKKESNENPVYYVQYAHARISSILRTAVERGYNIPSYGDADVSLLNLPEEFELIKTIDKYPELIEGCAKSLEPHRITFYINDLASLFHSYYNKYRVVSEDVELSKARLFLIKSVGIVLRNALGILGVSAPEKM